MKVFISSSASPMCLLFIYVGINKLKNNRKYTLTPEATNDHTEMSWDEWEGGTKKRKRLYYKTQPWKDFKRMSNIINVLKCSYHVTRNFSYACLLFAYHCIFKFQPRGASFHFLCFQRRFEWCRVYTHCHFNRFHFKKSIQIYSDINLLLFLQMHLLYFNSKKILFHIFFLHMRLLIVIV